MLLKVAGYKLVKRGFKDKMKNKKLLANQLFRLIIHRRDRYGDQRGKGEDIKWRSNVHGSVNEKLVVIHLNGNRTIVTPNINTDNTLKWICFDVENQLPNNEEMVKKIVSHLKKKYNLDSYVEFSGGLDGGRHYHVWVFLKPTQSEKAYRFVERVREELKLGKSFEIFPKQDRLTDRTPYGNQVKLPLGINRKTTLI